MTNFPVTASVGSDLQAALQNDVKVNVTENKSGKQFMKYDTYSGEWFIGKANTKITGEDVLINTQAIGHGWQLWVDSKLEEQTFVPFVQELPIAPEGMKDKRNQWQNPREARILGGMYEGDEDDMMFEFTGTSYGIKQAVDTLLNEIRVKSVETAEFLYPRVKLTAAEPYENPNKKNEMIYNPVFEIVEWCDMEGNPEGEKAVQVEDQTEEVAEEAPKRRRRRSA